MKSLLDQIKVPFLTVLFTLITFFVLVKLFGPIPFTINSFTTMKNDLFTVDGTGEVKTTPTTANISVGITKTAATADAAKSDANKVVNEITEKLKALGVAEKDIKTADFSSYPDRPLSGLDKITGYTVTENLNVTFDSVDKANQGLDLATAAGATNIGGVQFSVDESKKPELEQQARIEAVKNAKAKAQKLADAAGIKLGRVVNITESSNGNQPRMMYAQANMAMDKAISEPTQLNPGENNVTVQVFLSFETL